MFITLIGFLVVLGIIGWLVSMIPMEGTIKQIIVAVFIIVAVLGCLEAIGAVNFGILNSLPWGR